MLKSSIPFFFSLATLFSYSSISSDILRLSLCPALLRKGLKDQNKNTEDRKQAAKVTVAFFTH